MIEIFRALNEERVPCKTKSIVDDRHGERKTCFHRLLGSGEADESSEIILKLSTSTLVTYRVDSARHRRSHATGGEVCIQIDWEKINVLYSGLEILDTKDSCSNSLAL